MRRSSRNSADGLLVACVDVLQLTHGAVATIGGAGGGGQDKATNMLQKFWDSALALEPAEDESDTRSDISGRQYDVFSERQSSYPSFGPSNTFAFKLKVTARDGKIGHYRFNCGFESLTELMSVVLQRVGDDIDPTHLPRLMYIDDEGDKVLLATNSDLVAAVNFARISGSKALSLHLEESQEPRNNAIAANKDVEGWSTMHSTLIACTLAAVAVGAVLYLRRFNTRGSFM